MSNQYLKKRYDQTLQQIQQIEITLSQLPQGELYCTQNKSRIRWEYYLNKKRTFLSKKDYELAKNLAYKKYLTQKHKELTVEKKALEQYSKTINALPLRSDNLVAPDSKYRELILTNYKPTSIQLSEWQKQDYEKNPNHPEHLIHPSISGNILRSKSESMIDAALFQHKIPFRYECALKAGSNIIYPDFMIRHPKTGKIYLWEHFGMMDSPTYANTVSYKLRSYYQLGYIPMINLITTYENEEYPLTSIFIETMIYTYFES